MVLKFFNPALFLFIARLIAFIASSCPITSCFKTSSTFKTFVFHYHHFINWNSSPSWNYTAIASSSTEFLKCSFFFAFCPIFAFSFIFASSAGISPYSILQLFQILILFLLFFAFVLSSSILFLIHLLH